MAAEMFSAEPIDSLHPYHDGYVLTEIDEFRLQNLPKELLRHDFTAEYELRAANAFIELTGLRDPNISGISSNDIAWADSETARVIHAMHDKKLELDGEILPVTKDTIDWLFEDLAKEANPEISEFHGAIDCIRFIQLLEYVSGNAAIPYSVRSRVVRVAKLTAVMYLDPDNRGDTGVMDTYEAEIVYAQKAIAADTVDLAAKGKQPSAEVREIRLPGFMTQKPR